MGLRRPRKGERFIRIKTADGLYVGGYFDEESYVSTHPEPHDVYVARQCRMSSGGHFLEEMRESDGFWYVIQPGDIVEWLHQPELGSTEGERDHG